MLKYKNSNLNLENVDYILTKMAAEDDKLGVEICSFFAKFRLETPTLKIMFFTHNESVHIKYILQNLVKQCIC